MSDIINQNLDYSRPIKLAEDVYWVGFADLPAGLHCNPYLIVDEGEAVLIDGGSRPDFAEVMMKIMQTGIEPASISTLIYHHYDPDLCGSIPNLEDIILRDDLRIVSHRENNIFIGYYGTRSRLMCVESMGYDLKLKSGRVLKFFRTPYAHSPGSFITLDTKTGILFSSDIFGSYGPKKEWDLFMELPELCHSCKEKHDMKTDFSCATINAFCPLPGILNFHRRIMTSNHALQYALKQVSKAIPSIIAPQHGSVLHKDVDIRTIMDRLLELDDIGMDSVPLDTGDEL